MQLPLTRDAALGGGGDCIMHAMTATRQPRESCSTCRRLQRRQRRLALALVTAVSVSDASCLGEPCALSSAVMACGVGDASRPLEAPFRQQPAASSQHARSCGHGMRRELDLTSGLCQMKARYALRSRQQTRRRKLQCRSLLVLVMMPLASYPVCLSDLLPYHYPVCLSVSPSLCSLPM